MFKIAPFLFGVLLFTPQYINVAFTHTASGVTTPTFVQSADCSELAGETQDLGVSATFECRFPQPTLGGAGDLIVGGFANDATARDYSLSDDASNTYTYQTYTDTVNGELMAFFYSLGGASTLRITFTRNAAANFRMPWVQEWSGVGSFGAASAGAHGTTTGSSNNISSGSITPAQSGDLVIQQAFNDTVAGYSPGTTAGYSAGSQANITWNIQDSDAPVGYAVQTGVYSSTTTLNAAMSAATGTGYETQALYFAPGSGPAVPSGIRVLAIKHFWLTAWNGTKPTSPWTIQFPCPSSTNLAYIGFIGAHNNSDDLTAATINGHAMTATGALYNPVGDSQIHSWYAENVSFSPTETAVLTGSFTTGSAIGYCIVSPNPASSFQQRAEFSGTSAGTGTSLTTAVSPAMTPNFANDLLIGEVGVANNTLRGISPSGWIFNSEWWSGEAISNGGMDQNNGWGILYNPNTTAISTLSWPVQSSTLAVGAWAGDIVEFH